jgi:hypothetical protein
LENKERSDVDLLVPLSRTHIGQQPPRIEDEEKSLITVLATKDIQDNIAMFSNIMEERLGDIYRQVLCETLYVASHLV